MLGNRGLRIYLLFQVFYWVPLLPAFASHLRLSNGSLPSLGAHPIVTVSGLSAGAFAAVQYHIAFSATVNASGILAGGPFLCAEGDVVLAETSCMQNPRAISVPSLVVQTRALELSLSVDETKNIADDRVWLLSGTKDSVVATGVVEKTKEYYSHFLENPGFQIKAIFNQDGEHAMLTNSAGNACEYLGSPYINNCEFDAVGSLLQHIFHDRLTHPNMSNEDALHYGSLITFDQRAYVAHFGRSSMHETGYVFVPDQCANTSSGCDVHIALHGCLQTLDLIGDSYVIHSGYNRWAVANGIVVLYPQAKSLGDLNPNGCFDWWGYTGLDYATKVGIQNKAFDEMSHTLIAEG